MCQRPAAAAALTQRVGAVRAASTALGSPLFANECLNGNGTLGITAQTYDGVSTGVGGGGGGGGGGGYYYEGYGRKEDSYGRGRRRGSFGTERADALIRGFERRFVEEAGAGFASSPSEWSGLTSSLREMLEVPGKTTTAAVGAEVVGASGGGGGGGGVNERGETAVVAEVGGAGDVGPGRRLRRTRGRDSGGGGGGGGGDAATSVEAAAAVEYRASCSAPPACNPNSDLLGRDCGAAATVTGSGTLSSPLMSCNGETAEREVEAGAAMAMEVGGRREREVICADVEGSLRQQEIGGRTTAGGLPPFSKDVSGNSCCSNVDQTNNARGPVCSATTPEASSQSHLSSLESSLSNGSQYRGMEATGTGTVISTEAPFEKETRKGDMLSRLDGTVSTSSCLNAQMIGCCGGQPASNANWGMSMPLTPMSPFSTYGSSYYPAATSFPSYGGLNGNAIPLRNSTQIQSKAEETGVPVMGLPARPLCSDADASVSWIPQRMSFLQNGFASSATPDLPNLAARGSTPAKGFSEELGNLGGCSNGGAAGVQLPMVAQRGPRYCMDGSNDIQSFPQGCTAMGACHQDMMGYTHTDGNASSDVEDVVIDEKKRRRMMSNRDSARRSRQRRQERLELLERQAALLRVENSKLRSKTMSVTDQMLRYEEENKTLIDELSSLKEEVASLRRAGSGSGGALTGSATGNSSDAGCESSGAGSKQCETTKEQCAPSCSEDPEVRWEGVMLHEPSPQNRQNAKRMANGVNKDVARLNAQGVPGATSNDESCTGIEEIGDKKNPLANLTQDETNRTACRYHDTLSALGNNTEGEAGIPTADAPSCTCGDHSVASSSPDELGLDDAQMLVIQDDDEMLGNSRQVGEQGESAPKEEGGMTIGDVRRDGQNQTGYRSDCFFGYGMPNTMANPATPCNFDGQGSDGMIAGENWTLEELLFNFEAE